MPYGTVNADVIQSSVANTSLGAGNASIMKNRIINGAMLVNQRAWSGTITTDGTYTLDRYQAFSSSASKYSVVQSSDAPAGFVNSLLVTSLAATSVGATDYYFIRQCIEGLNCTDLGWGSASAKTVTVSFWVKSSLTGTFGGTLENSAQNRSYPFSYTISSASTWEQKTITVAGDTTGTWLTTNGIGIMVQLGLGVGTTYSDTAGAWTSKASAWSATGATSVVGTNGATFAFTGLQLEVGSSATGYEYRPYGTEYNLCLRYYYRNKASAANQMLSSAGQCYATTGAVLQMVFPVPLRAAPTAVEQTGSAADYAVWNTGTSNVNLNSVPAFNAASSTIGRVEITVASGLASGNATSLVSRDTANAYFGWSAEL